MDLVNDVRNVMKLVKLTILHGLVLFDSVCKVWMETEAMSLLVEYHQC